MNVLAAEKILAHTPGAEEAPLSVRLQAHSVLLREVAPKVYTHESVMLAALADICLALTRIGAR